MSVDSRGACRPARRSGCSDTTVPFHDGEHDLDLDRVVPPVPSRSAVHADGRCHRPLPPLTRFSPTIVCTASLAMSSVRVRRRRIQRLVAALHRVTSGCSTMGSSRGGCADADSPRQPGSELRTGGGLERPEPTEIRLLAGAVWRRRAALGDPGCGGCRRRPRSSPATTALATATGVGRRPHRRPPVAVPTTTTRRARPRHPPAASTRHDRAPQPAPPPIDVDRRYP